MNKLSICVYCGSRPGELPAYTEAARAVGTEIGRRGWQLIYGGGRAGLMGEVADATLTAGGTVVGVIPESLMGRELGHRGLTELHVVDTMHQRKTMMAERSDAFLALPGGIGTFEELFESMTWTQLGLQHKPVGLVDVAGFWAPVRALLDGAVDHGFLDATVHDAVEMAADAATVLDRWAAWEPPALGKWADQDPLLRSVADSTDAV